MGYKKFNLDCHCEECANTTKQSTFTKWIAALPTVTCNDVKYLAFTLAEVLITLTIIGVIAAITIPNLMKKYEKHVLLTQLKNWYSEFSNTIGEFRVQNDNVWEVYGQSFFLDNGLRDKPFIKFLDEKYGDLNKKGNTNIDSSSLWLDKNGLLNYKKLDGGYGRGKYPDLDYYFYRFKTYRCKNGAMFAIQYIKEPAGDKAWQVVVDVNGPKKGPNVVGRDTFHFYIGETTAKLYGRYESSDGGSVFQYRTTSNYNKSCNPQNSTYKYNGVTCAERIMKEGWQMNY